MQLANSASAIVRAFLGCVGVPVEGGLRNVSRETLNKDQIKGETKETRELEHTHMTERRRSVMCNLSVRKTGMWERASSV